MMNWEFFYSLGTRNNQYVRLQILIEVIESLRQNKNNKIRVEGDAA